MEQLVVNLQQRLERSLAAVERFVTALREWA
jgi:hypothetical protein